MSATVPSGRLGLIPYIAYPGGNPIPIPLSKEKEVFPGVRQLHDDSARFEADEH